MHQLSWLLPGLYLVVSHAAPNQSRGKDKHLRQSGKAGYSSPFCMTAMDLSSRVSQLSPGSTVRFIAPCLASPPSSPRLLAVGGHWSSSCRASPRPHPSFPTHESLPLLKPHLSTSIFHLLMIFSLSPQGFLLYSVQLQPCWCRQECYQWFSAANGEGWRHHINIRG